jgi:phosphatidylserine/phosphatidylglycerophosphate/cardiolipin synthase-like enzyme
MSRARELVQLEAHLRASGIDVFSPTAEAALLNDAQYATVFGRFQHNSSISPSAAVLLCLQSLRVQSNDLSPRLINAELVATLPPETPGNVRPTNRVVREMVANARAEIIILGYELTDLELVRLLARSTDHGVDVVVICDRGRGTAQRLTESWPVGSLKPKIFQDSERPGSAPYASMHAKALLVDAADLLISSANFTFHGLQGNIEMGIRISGAPASEARKIFSYLVEERLVQEYE